MPQEDAGDKAHKERESKQDFYGDGRLYSQVFKKSGEYKARFSITLSKSSPMLLRWAQSASGV